MVLNKYATSLAVGITLVISTAAIAETVKRGMVACGSDDLLDEAMTYAAKSDTQGITQLLLTGKCTVLSVGEQVSVINSGFLTTTIRYKGVKLFTPSEAIRR